MNPANVNCEELAVQKINMATDVLKMAIEHQQYQTAERWIGEGYPISNATACAAIEAGNVSLIESVLNGLGRSNGSHFAINRMTSHELPIPEARMLSFAIDGLVNRCFAAVSCCEHSEHMRVMQSSSAREYALWCELNPKLAATAPCKNCSK